MGILDDVVVNAKSAAESVGKKAEQIVDVSKLRIAIAEVNAEVSKRYQALGEYVYNNNAAMLSADPEATGLISEIGELKMQQESMNKELLGKQNKKACSACGKLSGVAAVFCSNCGAKLTEDKPDDNNDAGCGCGCGCGGEE